MQAFTPVSVLLVSAAFGLKELTRKILLIVTLISFGVALASYGEIDFELVGFLVQVGREIRSRACSNKANAAVRPQALAICIESCRLVLVQRLLQGFGLDPIASLYYMAPVRPSVLGVGGSVLIFHARRSASRSTPSFFFRSRDSASSPTQ